MPLQVALWSVEFDKIDGQAIVTRRVVEQQKCVKWTSAIYKPGGGFALVTLLKAIARLWAVTIARKPDLIYIVCSRSGFGFIRDVPALACGLLGRRVVVHAHGSDLTDLLRRPLFGDFARYLYRHCEIIVPSRHLARDLAKLGMTSIHLCENFSLAAVAQNAKPSSTGAFHVLWNSNVLASKGIRELIAGAAMARRKGVPVRVTVLGRPLADANATCAEMSDFLTCIEKEEWVEVVGPVIPIQAQRYLCECDLVALPSTYKSECQPLAIIDAMCAGREVLVSATPALLSTVRGYPAYIVQPEPASIADALWAAFESRKAKAPLLRAMADDARARFSASRFDREMSQILRGKPLGRNPHKALHPKGLPA
jgi:glycosyltransferase involved in cell wall biosynthesis